MRNVNSSSELFAATPFHFTAVSSEFGNAFSKSRYKSGSVITPFILAIVSSTTDELNVLHAGSGLI
jgi:hypothetical protein